MYLKTRITLLLFLISLIGFGQQYDIRFHTYTLKDGLSQSTINCILQDSKGFIWVGTQDGLNRFDGYSFKVYSHHLGDSTSISSGFVREIVELSGNRLLVATEKGLNLFDQRTEEFIHFLPGPEQNTLDDDNIYALVKASGAEVWIGTEKGLNLFDEDKLLVHRHVLEINGHPLGNAHIRDMILDANGKLWIATEGHGLIHYDPAARKVLGQWDRDKLGSDNAMSLGLIGREMWVGTTKGVFILDAETYTPITTYDNVSAMTYFKEIRVIYQDKDQNVWLGTFDDGLARVNMTNGHIDFFRRKLNNPTSLNDNIIYAVYEDSFGNIWVGTNNGISRFDKQKQYFHHYRKTSESGLSLSHNNVWSILEAGDHVLIGTNKGIDIFNRELNVSKHADLKMVDGGSIGSSSSNVLFLFEDSKKRILAGTGSGLMIFDPRTLKFSKYRTADPSVNDGRVYQINEDREGNIWCATKKGVLIINDELKISKRFTSLDSISGHLHGDIVRVVHEDVKGNMWIGGDALGLCKVNWSKHKPDFLQITNYDADPDNSSALSNSSILTIHSGKDGILWIGTFGGGLNRFDRKTGKFERYTESEGLANNVIYGILQDKSNRLWLSTNKGLSRFDQSRRDFLNFEENDGLQSNEFNIGAYFKSSSGELFFGGINGFNSFFPEEIKINNKPPRMLLTNFYLFNKEVTEVAGEPLNKRITYLKTLELDYKENVLTLELAALHFSAPEKNRHAFKLEGFNEEWVYIGNNRMANYTNLDPGTYVFKIKGANSDGVWSEEQEVLVIQVNPPFYKTWKFRIILGILILASIYFFYKSRLKRIEEQKELLEIQVRERTYEVMEQKEETEHQKMLLEAEKDKVEKLLLNILPEETVDELKHRGKARARSYRTVSVMFADFEGFTRISENMKPQELVAELDGYFIQFDEIIEKWNVEKIKTMGDAYMCAGGIPIRNKSNPIEIVLAGLEMQRHVRSVAENKAVPWNLRIGIHTGSLVAGVVGIKRFAYDIWGDTVNVASRMESGGENGMVNVSGTTYEQIKEFFVCEHRGKVEAKNKGEVDMYFVHQIKPELSVDGEGIEPNELFWKYVDLYLYSSINYRKAEKFVLKKLEAELPNDLHYHDINHTKDVCQAVERLALMEGLVGEDVFLLKSAALYHDAGFTQQYESNEPIGAELAREALHRFGYSEEQIQTVEELILATKVPQQPKNHLEQIICDADLDYLGRDDFHPIAEGLKRELMERGKIETDEQWDEIQIKFLTAHQYFTESAIKMRQAKKMEHVEEIKQRFASYKKTDQES